MADTATQTAVQAVVGGASALADGNIVRLSANKTIVKAQGDSQANFAGLLGVVQTGGTPNPGNSTTVVTAGLAQVRLESGLSPVFADVIYPSPTTAGLGTLTQGGLGALPVAMVFSTSGYSVSNPLVLAIVIPAAAVSAVPAANWDLSLVRYFFVDNENGDDSNIGYIDAAAGTVFAAGAGLAVALRTLEELRNRIPRVGASRSAVTLMAPRSDNGNYLNKAGASDYFDNNYTGYINLIFRGSDFTNSTVDRVNMAGYTDALTTGPNADGSWTLAGALAGFTATVAAGVLPARNDLTGYKLEFKGNATPGATANGNVVADRTSNTDFDFGTTETVANLDEFFFRRPGVKVTTLVGHGGLNGPATGVAGFGMVLGGIEFTTAPQPSIMQSGRVSMPFVRFAGNVSLDFVGGELAAFIAYFDESGTNRFIRCGIDARGTFQIDGGGSAIGSIECSAFHAASTFLNTTQMRVGGGCYFNNSASFSSLTNGVRNSFFGSFAIFGSTSAATRAAKIVVGIIVDGCLMQFTRTDLAGATNGILVRGEGNNINFENVTGNPTGYVLDVSGSRSSKFYIQTSVTSTGTPDIVLSGPASTTIAGLATTNVIDQFGNEVQGPAGHVVDVCKLIDNQSGGALAIGDLVRGNGTTNQVTSTQANSATLVDNAVEGVLVTPPASAALGYIAVSGSPVINFDGAPTPGAPAYLSTGTVNAATTTIPVAAGNNHKLRLGRVINVVTGTLARVSFHPETVGIAADGAA